MLVTTLIAAATDLRSRRIPNWLVVAGLLAGVTLNVVLAGWSGLLAAALGCALALAVYVPLFILRAMGGGDVKLMAAVGSMAGPQNWLTIFILASLAGGVMAIIILLSRGALRKALGNVGFILQELSRFRLPYKSRAELDIKHPGAASLPHAVTIAAGVCWFLFAF